MGTRNLTMVISNGETKIAQYGQWDGYPSGQGVTALNFLLNNNLENFREKLNRIKFIDEVKQAEIDEYVKSIGSDNGWLDMKQAELYQEKYPHLTRDTAAEILQLVMDCEDSEIWLHDHTTFAADSLFCEWGYVIDLDKGTFEIYKGFQNKPLGKAQRFKSMEKEGMKYYPIRMIKKYKLEELPTEDEFLKNLVRYH